MSGELEFAGGSGGMTADLLDMRTTAQVLDDCGTDLAGIAGRAGGLAVDPTLLVSIAFSPGSAARAEALLLSAATQLTTRVLRLQALALLLRTKADLIELADNAQAFGVRAAEQVGGHLAGTFAVPLGLSAVTGGVLWFAAGTADEAGDAVLDALRGDIGLTELGDRLRAAPGEQAGDMRETATMLLRDHPGVTDAVIGGLPGFLNGAAGPLAPLVPDTYEGVLTALLGLGSPHGLFNDRPVTASAQGPSAPYTGTTGDGLDSLRELWASANQLNSAAQDDPDGSAVRILRTVEGGVVRWVVQVPGTQQWNPLTGSDPSDVTTNIELMDDGQTLVLPAIVQAMREAGIGADEEVMLMGHSQGGIAAMALANDDAVRAEFDVTTVFTGGSPVGRFELPPGITAVSLEHLQDPVPRLDSEANPDLPGWTTVTRDVGSELAAEDAEGRRIAAEAGADYIINPIAPHSGTRYEQTAGLLDSAADRADGTDPDDESARRVVEALEPFLNGPADFQDWTLIRSDP